MPRTMKMKALIDFPYGTPMRDHKAGAEIDIEESHMQVLKLAGRIGPIEEKAATGIGTGSAASAATVTEAARLHQQAQQNQARNTQQRNQQRGNR